MIADEPVRSLPVTLFVPTDVSDPLFSAWLSTIYPFVLAHPSGPAAAVARLKLAGVGITVAEYRDIMRRFQLSLITFVEVPGVPVGPAAVFATVPDIRAFVHRFLHLSVDRGLTRALHEGDDEVMTTMYVDTGGRRICGMRVTLVMLSFVDLFISSGALSTVCVLGCFLGQPDWEAINAYVDRLVCNLRTVVVPTACLPACRRDTHPRGMEYPVRLIDISDHAAAVHTYSLSPPAGAWFPSKPILPGKPARKQPSRLAYELSPLCDRTYISMVCDGPRPPCTPVTRSIGGGGAFVNWAYGRHALPHGLGCLVCMIVVDLDQRGFPVAAEWVSHSFRLCLSWFPRRYTAPELFDAWMATKASPAAKPSPSAAPASCFQHPKPADAARGSKKLRESPSPPHNPSLSSVKGFLRDCRGAAPALPALPSFYTDKSHSRIPVPGGHGYPTRSRPGHGLASPADVTWLVCHVLADELTSAVWQRGLQYLRLLLDPDASRADEYLEDGAVTALGRRVWDDLIRLSCRLYPWRASAELLDCARRHKDVSGPVAHALASTSHDARLVPMHVSAYLCFWHGTYLYNWIEPFERASVVYEEAFEHVFNYLFVVSGALGISHAVQRQNAHAIALLAVMASLCGFPRFELLARWRGRRPVIHSGHGPA